MASRLEKIRQRVNNAENAAKPAKVKAKKDDIPEGPLSEEDQERIFLQMLGQQRATVQSWRQGFYALPGAVGALAAFMLFRHTQNPWSEEASHFLPLKDFLSAGTLAFALALIVLTCALSLIANFSGHKPLRFLALALSLLPTAILGAPFVQRPELLSFKPVPSMPGYVGFWSLLWAAPLSALVVTGTHVGVERIWEGFEKELRAWFDKFKYEHKSA